MDVSYCEGWDPVARAAAGPLSTRVALERHQAGEQYAALLLVAGRAVGLIEVAPADLYVGAWFLDGEFRRVSEVDCRLLEPGRMFLLAQRTGRTADTEPSRSDEEKWIREIVASPDGFVQEQVRETGALSVRVLESGLDDYWAEAPEFGDWGSFIRSFPEALQAAGLDVAESVVVQDVSPPEGTGLPAGVRPWRAPRGLAPDPSYLGWLFTDGTRLRYDISGGMWVTENEEKIKKVTVEVLDEGALRMPSGALIACDPGYLGEPPVLDPASPGRRVETYAHQQSHRAFTATVPPGSYPVLVSAVRFADNPNHTRVAAAKVVIRDIPAESWEMALRPGQDTRVLSDGQFHGFGVDRGTGCFYDAAAATALAPHAEVWLTAPFDSPDTMTAQLTDESSGANMIAFHSGWGDGSYPVWIGRSADRQVACFVADMLLMRDNVALDAD